MDDLLHRIADALDRLAPAACAEPTPDAPAYSWHDGRLSPVTFAPLPLALLTGIDDQRDAVLTNFRRHALAIAAHDVLLWGARGSGKSALVKSAVAALQLEGLPIALTDLAASDIGALPAVFALASALPRRVIVFLDDIGFDDDMGDVRALRSVLDGGSSARPENVRLAVTSNRRHIVSRNLSEQDSAINPRDVVDDRLALADRFGLSLGFHVADQPAYLAMVEGYARAWDLPFDAADALLFAATRGSRSGRVAWHYLVELAGRAGRSLGN